MEDIKELKTIPRFCPTIGELPTSYLMSMTYLEQVTWICNYIDKEIIPKINENADLTNELIGKVDLVQEEVIEIKEYVDKYLKDIDDIKAEIIVINNTLETLQNAINLTNEEIARVHDELETIINQNYAILKDYIDVKIGLVNNRIDNIEIGEIEIYNPTNGLFQPLQEVINDLYGITNKDGLTATEFDALDLTATAFDSYDITAYEFDSAGKIILV
nr:MAG TPA: hypothetical protein [Caudoviricetes sp.]